jgi:L-aspartate oxidase
VADLLDWGVEFARRGAGLDLGIEGGHSHRRIVHARDRTGPAIEGALLESVAGHARIHLLEHHSVLELRSEGRAGRRRCGGAWVLDTEAGERFEVRSRATVLATGGSAALYRHTTNPAIATGDGVALAHRAGAAIADMEFVQFHPTALYPAEEHAFLISEALRGEGAVLRGVDGERFMERYDARGDLAPRDVVARAVDQEMRSSDAPHMWLDATGLPNGRLEERFPHIHEGCLRRGLDARAEPIPVVPAAHYVCGGVWTDRDGHSTLPGLLAVGECACTGVHGANRLASNSLLEAVVFAERAASVVLEELRFTPPPATQADPGVWPGLSGIAAGMLASLRGRVRDMMWSRLGIVRSVEDMEQGASLVDGLRREWYAASVGLSGSGDRGRWADAAETLNMIEVARLMIRCALWRRESRGLHYVREFPHRDNERFLRDSLIAPVD